MLRFCTSTLQHSPALKFAQIHAADSAPPPTAPSPWPPSTRPAARRPRRGRPAPAHPAHGPRQVSPAPRTPPPCGSFRSVLALGQTGADSPPARPARGWSKRCPAASQAGPLQCKRYIDDRFCRSTPILRQFRLLSSAASFSQSSSCSRPARAGPARAPNSGGGALRGLLLSRRSAPKTRGIFGVGGAA